VRIADKMGFDQVKNNLSKNRSDMADLQNQAATQKRVTKPSDDPLAATRVLAARTEIAGGQQYLKSVNQAKTFLEYSDQSLGELSDILVRAKELAISQSNDASASKHTREVVASEIEQLHSQAVQVGNRKIGDRFLFAGFRTTRAPFDANGVYHGDNGEMQVTINKEAKVAMNLPGNRVFLGQGLSVNSVGASNGQNKKAPMDIGPDSDPLHSSTSGGAQMRGPASSVGSPLPAFVPAESKADDAAVPPSDPNNTAVTAEGAGPDIGATWRTGTNVFTTLQRLENAMRTNDKEAIQDSLDTLDSAIAQVVLARSQLGSRVSTLNSVTDTLQKGQVDAKGLASSLEDADTFELVSDINKTESTLKAALATSGKLIQPSLLDFLK
jgi:flagellar hook-associated protein 3 FlgL